MASDRVTHGAEYSDARGVWCENQCFLVMWYNGGRNGGERGQAVSPCTERTGVLYRWEVERPGGRSGMFTSQGRFEQQVVVFGQMYKLRIKY